MSLWRAEPLILASKSSVRRTLLEAAGIPVEIEPAKIDERAIESSKAASASAKGVALLLAREKALEVAGRKSKSVLGADQTLALGERRFSKPGTVLAAREQLKALAGKIYELHAAAAVAQNGKVVFETVATARLAVRPLSETFLDAYLAAAGDRVLSSVGAYQLEGPGVHLFERIDGDHLYDYGITALAASRLFPLGGARRFVTMLRACVIGHPVVHSRSPLIHNHWLSLYGIAGEYVREDIAPAGIETFLKAFPLSRYVGGNVTVPHKEIAFAAASERDAVAEALGAVNTLWHKDGKLFGGNTDVYGFLANLDESMPHWDERTKTALILGAGGSARAAVHGLLERSVKNILVANRTWARAEQLAAHFGKRITPIALSDISSRLAEADLLVSTTTLGMRGEPPLEIDLAALKRGAIVYDFIYAPLETSLLAQARRRGHVAVDGLGMLLHQAVPAFERWFGVRPKVTPELRALVAADLKREGLA